MSQDIVIVTPDDLDNTTLVVNAADKLEVVTATVDVKGVTTLATAAVFPQTGDAAAITPDYLAAALAAMPDAFD